MDLKRFLADKNLQGLPAALTGCRVHGNSFDSCDHDVVIFDGKSQSNQIFSFENQFVNLHHHSIDDDRTDSLIRLDGMQIIMDDSWELGTLLSKIGEKRSKLFRDHAKNCLFDSLFCCEKCKQGLESSDVFYPCWQKCASYLLADAILALNQKTPGPSHMLELARQFEKNSTNEKISVIAQTLGIERATPSLLERMAKSTMGFSDMVEDNDQSKVIQNQHDYFVKNTMFSDCYFYLGYINKINFIKIKDSVSQRPDLIHILRVAFDLESDPALVSNHVRSVQEMCNDILSSVLRG